MKLLTHLLDSPESATNRPAALRRALENANREAGKNRHGWRCLSTNARLFLLGLLAFALVFGTGYVLGVKSTNDYFQEVTR